MSSIEPQTAPPGRADLLDRYRRNRARSRALFALRLGRCVLQSADRAPPSDRVLRRPPARLQLQHAGQEGPWRPESSTARLEDLFARGIDPPNRRLPESQPTPGCPVAVPRDVAGLCRRGGPARDRCVDERRHRSAWSIPCSTGPRRSSRFSSTRRCTRRRCDTCGTACPSSRSTAPAGYQPAHERGRPAGGVDRDSRRARDAWRRSRRDHVRVGQRMPGVVGRRPELRDRAARCDERALHGVRRGGRLPRPAMVDGGRLAVAPGRTAHASPVLGARRRRLVLARDVRAAFRCRRRGPSTSVSRKPRRSRDGAARASRRRASSSARPTDARQASAPHPWGDDDPGASPRRLRLRELGSGTRRQPS